MKLIYGNILDVIDKGEPDKRWAIIGIQTMSKDRDGFDLVETVKVRVFGDQIKNGLHNAYRSAKGTDVYMPVNIDYDEKYKQVNYSLSGMPVRLQVVQPVQKATA